MQSVFVCLDTSAINALWNDPAREQLAQILRSVAVVRPSAFNVNEIAQTPDPVRRQDLLRFLGTLGSDAAPLQLPNLIVREIMRAYASGRLHFSIEVTADDDAIRALRNPELVTDRSRIITAEWTANVENAFDAIALSLRERAQAARTTRSSPYFGSASDLIRFLMFRPGEKYRQLLAAMYLAETGEVPSRAATEHFAAHPAFKLFFGAFAYGLHRRSMRTAGHSRRNASAVDLQQGVYLAFSDVFVTRDARQFRGLRFLSALNRDSRCEVLKFGEFRERLLR